jgi:hypothetical protein
MSTVSHFIQHRSCALQAIIIIEPGFSTRVKPGESRLGGRLGNKGLPEGALDGGKWTVTFRQTFFKYLGDLNQNIWGLEKNKTG